MNLSKFILFLSNVEGIGDASIRKLIISNCFNNVDFESTSDILEWIKKYRVYFSKKFNIDDLSVDDLIKAKKTRIDLEQKLNNENIKYITWYDNEYPECFKQMNDFPIIIYYKGNIELLNDKKKCAIIGTRKVTDKGAEKCKHLSSLLASHNFVVVSGLAEGCDTLAHQACLDVNGKTIAILGCGIDSIYPKQNKLLADEIIKKDGLLISEYPVGFKAKPFSLVQRDRLQTSSSNFVIAVQTDTDGGTMHACKAALNKYEKKVYVVSPKELDYEIATGNLELINKYFARELTHNSLEELLKDE